MWWTHASTQQPEFVDFCNKSLSLKKWTCVFAVRDAADGGSSGMPTKPSAAGKSVSASTSVQSVINGSGESTGGTPLSSSSDIAELPDDQLSWEAFFGKMASKGDLLALGREEQIVVKQQMLDRLVQLERELQERTMMVC